MTEKSLNRSGEPSIATTRQLMTSLQDQIEKSFESVLPEGGASDVANGLWSQDFKAFLSPQTLKSLFFTEDWVFIIVNLIADEISQNPLKILKKKIVSGETIYEPDDAHHLNDLFAQPNPLQDYHTWNYLYLVELMLMGNTVNWYARSANELHILPWEGVQLEFDANGGLKRYLFMASGDQQTQAQGIGLPLDEIVHQKRPNPATSFAGLSPFVPGRKSVLFNRHTADYLNAFYVRQALPGLAITIGKDANEERALRLLRSYEMSVTGRTNQRRTLMLPKGTDVKPLTHTIADQQLIELVRMNRETIINMLRVPKHALSLAETGSLGSEEHKQALRYFWTSTLRPLCLQIGGTLSKFFAKDLGKDRVIRYDLSGVEELREDFTTKADLGTKLLNQWTLNEVRAEIWKKEPLEGGDKTPGQTPVNPMILGASPFAGGQGASMPTPVTASTVAPCDHGQEIEKRNARLQHFLGKRQEWWQTRTKAINDHTGKKEEAIRSLFLDTLLDWAEIAVKVTRDEIDERKAMTKAEPNDDGPPAHWSGRRKTRARLIREFNERENAWLDGTTKELATTVDAGYGVMLQTVFDEKDRDAIQAIGERDAKNRRLMLEARQIDTFKTIRNTSADAVTEIIEAGLEEQLTVQQIAARIQAKFGDPEETSRRAMTVARTEVLSAVSLGQAAAMQNAAEVIPDLKKVWINADDDRVRGNPGGQYPDSKADHWTLQGQVKDHDEPFVDERSGAKMDYPRDPKGGAENTINCFPGTTNVSAIGARGAFQRHYRGPLVTVNFASGHKLSGTPNHPVLTPNGWVALGRLAKGHKVFNASGFDTTRLVQHDGHDVKSSIGEVFKTLSIGSFKMRKTGSAVDFHGDGTTENVDIIDVGRRLHDRVKTSGEKMLSNFSLANSNLGQIALLRDSGQSESCGRVGPSHRSVGASNLLPSSRCVEGRPLDSFGLATAANLNSSEFQPTNDSTSRDAKSPAELQNGNLLVDVQTDDVLSVDVDTKFDGHVYNLQTSDGYYLANGFVVHNCRCTWLIVSKEDLSDFDIPGPGES